MTIPRHHPCLATPIARTIILGMDCLKYRRRIQAIGVRHADHHETVLAAMVRSRACEARRAHSRVFPSPHRAAIIPAISLPREKSGRLPETEAGSTTG